MAASTLPGCATQAPEVVVSAIPSLEPDTVAARPVERLRLFVADASLGVAADGDALPEPADVQRALEALGRRAAAFRPDVVVLFDVPYASRRPSEGFEVGAWMSVETQLLHRAEARVPAGGGVLGRLRPGARGCNGATGYRARMGGVLILSRVPVTEATWTPAYGTNGPWSAPGGVLRATLDAAGGHPIHVDVVDGERLPRATQGWTVARGPACDGRNTAARTAATPPLCASLPEGWEVLRANADGPAGPAGLPSIRLESRPRRAPGVGEHARPNGIRPASPFGDSDAWPQPGDIDAVTP